VFARPLSGRHLFEEVIRENLYLGRPDNVSPIFNRRITQRFMVEQWHAFHG